jgi:hypothetical protein
LKTIIVPVVLYGCETLSFTLREEHRLRVLKNSVLKRIFGPKRGEVTGEWRKFLSEEFYNLYLSPNIISKAVPLHAMKAFWGRGKFPFSLFVVFYLRQNIAVEQVALLCIHEILGLNLSLETDCLV